MANILSIRDRIVYAQHALNARFSFKPLGALLWIRRAETPFRSAILREVQCRRFIFALVIASAAWAGSLKAVRRISLSDYIQPRGPFAERRVTALAFSPDEQWLAATVDEGRTARLLVLSRERSATALRYSGTIPPVRGRPGEFGRVAWSPDGNFIVIGSNPPLLIDLERETTCELTASRGAEVFVGGFSSPVQIAVAEVFQGKSRLILFDVTCKPLQYRDLEAPVINVDAAHGPGWILVSTADNRVSIYDATNGKLVRSWGRPMRTQVGLLANGEIVCEAGRPSRAGSPPECWSVKDGIMPEPPDVVGGAPFSWSRRASIAAFTDGKYAFDAFFETGKEGVKRGVVWNVERGEMMAAWKPDQEGCGGIRDLWSDCKQPAAFAISPEGGFLAESKAGQLRIYRIVD